MVLTKNLYPRKKAKPSQTKLQPRKKIQQKILKTQNGSLMRLTLKNGKLTSCGITLEETSVNNSILRTHLERYNFNGLMNISRNHGNFNLGKNIKRKRNLTTPVHDERPHKRLRINGSSIKESSFRQQIPNRITKNLYDIVNNAKLKKCENIDRNNLQKDFDKKENEYVKSPKVFEKSKFKIRLGTKPKKNYKKTKKGEMVSDDVVSRSRVKVTKKLKNTDIEYGTGIYYLKFKRDKNITEARFNYKFQQLVTDVKNMSLPSATWKIKVIIRQNKISAITFTNKQELERSVTFSLETDHYKLLVDNKLAHLLGSPETIDTPEDIQILLDILEHIDSSSPIISYR